MKEKPKARLSRRQLVAGAAAALVAGALPAACRRAARRAAGRKTLRILQWSHFVPRFDAWFDGVYTKEWGARNGTEVIVDHMSATEVNARGASEAAAGHGHDLFLFQSPPAAYADRVIDHREIVEAVERRHGKMIPLARKSTLDAKTGKHFAFSDSYVPDPGNYRIDLWREVGFPNGPDTWDDLRAGGRKIKEKLGNPVGLGLSQETDTNMALRGALWSFGGAEQDESGRVVIDSKETIACLEFMRALYRETMTPEVFTWDPSSNNRMMLAGRASFICNAISVTRTAERENPAMARKIGLTVPLRGPVRRIASEHIMNCYVIWRFAENVEGAKAFLADLVGEFGSVFRESEFYNFPCFPQTVPDMAARLAGDPRADPPGKYSVLKDALEWSTNVGYPGYATPGIDEAFSTFVIPTMFSRVARDEMTAPQAAKAAADELERLFSHWRGKPA